MQENKEVISKTDSPLGFDVQTVRLIDVFFIAPFLMYVGSNKSLSQPVRLTLWGLGVATLLYNGHHYLKNKQ
jgi:hypothetical protein